MAAAPHWKVYDAQGEYQAACKEITAAGSLMAFYGLRATIRDGHKVICWTEGADGYAAESYDVVAAVASQRMVDDARKNRRKQGAV